MGQNSHTDNPFREFTEFFSLQPEVQKYSASGTPKYFLHEHLPEEICDKLTQYHDLLLKWNRNKQIVSNKTLDSLWLRHFIDSAQLYPLYEDRKKYRWLDIGSGGGFPGLVLATIASEFAPENEFILVESNSYKAEFLRHVARKLGLNAIVHNARVEHLEPQEANIVSARAVASLKTLLKWTEIHLAKHGRGFFLKGSSLPQELQEAKLSRKFRYTQLQSWTTKSGIVLLVDEIRK